MLRANIYLLLKGVAGSVLASVVVERPHLILNVPGTFPRIDILDFA